MSLRFKLSGRPVNDRSIVETVSNSILEIRRFSRFTSNSPEQVR
jgi:hypothetical protein